MPKQGGNAIHIEARAVLHAEQEFAELLMSLCPGQKYTIHAFNSLTAADEGMSPFKVIFVWHYRNSSPPITSPPYTG